MMSYALLGLMLLASPEPDAAMDDSCGAVDETGSAAVEIVQNARAACETARTRFRELFGDPVPDARIVFWDRPGYDVGLAGDVAVVFWPASGVMPEHGGGPGPAEVAARAQWQDMFPHEISHALLAARFYPTGGSGNHGGYGTPLPDWLDEGVAIWAESTEHRAARIEHARALPAAERDLRGILAEKHPAVANGGFDASAAYLAGEASRIFYARSIAVLAFAFERGGTGAITELAQRLRAEPGRLEDALLGLPGMPDTADELDAAWQLWIRDDRPQI
jgi:hypothetical protein